MTSKHTDTCTCRADSPFLWATNPRPSLFADASSYRRSEASTISVEAQRAKGMEPGFMPSLSRKSEERTLATREFFTYSRAKLNVFPKEPVNE